MSTKTFEVYVTKYSLTQGILKMPVTTTSFPGMVKSSNVTFFKGEWFEDFESAVLRAEEMREKKLQSLERQMQKIKSLDFRSTDSPLGITVS